VIPAGKDSQIRSHPSALRSKGPCILPLKPWTLGSKPTRDIYVCMCFCVALSSVGIYSPYSGPIPRPRSPTQFTSRRFPNSETRSLGTALAGRAMQEVEGGETLSVKQKQSCIQGWTFRPILFSHQLMESVGQVRPSAEACTAEEDQEGWRKEQVGLWLSLRPLLGRISGLLTLIAK
jgi:hypothetical protein